MKFRILSTALLISISLASQVQADVVRQSNEQQTIERSSDGDRYDWQWDRGDRQRDNDNIDRRDDIDQRVEIRVNRGDRNGRRSADDYYYDDIDQIYQEVLGRRANRDEERTYTRRLEKGDSLRDIRAKIAASGEARDVVKDIYRDITGNNASRSTIKDYTRRLADGWTLGDVEDDITANE